VEVNIGVVKLLPVPACVFNPASLYHVAVYPVVQPLALKVALLPEHTVAPVPVGVGAVHGIWQVGEVTVTSLVQPFKIAVMVTSVPVGILLTVVPLTVPKFAVMIPLVVTVTLYVKPFCAHTGVPAVNVGSGFTVAVTITPLL
jgi:hypothetical protein